MVNPALPLAIARNASLAPKRKQLLSLKPCVNDSVLSDFILPSSLIKKPFRLCLTSDIMEKYENNRILRERSELGHYNFDIRHKLCVQDVALITFSRMCNAVPGISLVELHKSLGHAGRAHFYHFIRQSNLFFSGEEIKAVCKNCRTCAEAKPQFVKPESQTAKADMLTRTFPAITRQPIELDRCSNPLRCGKSSSFDLKKL